MNSVNIIGNMTGDIEIKYVSDNFSVGKFTIALNKRVKKGNDYIDKPQFFEVAAYNGTAETISNYFSKGSRIGITGELDFESWENDKGRHSKVTIVCKEITFIDKKEKRETPPEPKQKAAEIPEIDIEEIEIPF